MDYATKYRDARTRFHKAMMRAAGIVGLDAPLATWASLLPAPVDSALVIEAAEASAELTSALTTLSAEAGRARVDAAPLAPLIDALARCYASPMMASHLRIRDVLVLAGNGLAVAAALEAKNPESTLSKLTRAVTRLIEERDYLRTKANIAAAAGVNVRELGRGRHGHRAWLGYMAAARREGIDRGAWASDMSDTEES